MKRKILTFDFDGTLTTRDTLIEFIRYAHGTPSLIAGFLLHAPLLVLMKLRLYSNQKAKQRIFSYFFKGMSEDRFNDICSRFALDNRRLLRPKGMETLQKAIDKGARVLIISASIDNWVAPFFSGITAGGTDTAGHKGNGITVVGTRIEVRNQRLTGRFTTPNCYGQEKVRRLLELFPDRETYHLTAFGDSRGDRELLAFADESHYKPFRQ